MGVWLKILSLFCFSRFLSIEEKRSLSLWSTDHLSFCETVSGAEDAGQRDGQGWGPWRGSGGGGWERRACHGRVPPPGGDPICGRWDGTVAITPPPP